MHTSLFFLESFSPPVPTDSNSEAAAIVSSTTHVRQVHGSVDIPNNAHQHHVWCNFSEDGEGTLSIPQDRAVPLSGSPVLQELCQVHLY